MKKKCIALLCMTLFLAQSFVHSFQSSSTRFIRSRDFLRVASSSWHSNRSCRCSRVTDRLFQSSFYTRQRRRSSTTHYSLLTNEHVGGQDEPYLLEDTIFALSSGSSVQATAVALIRLSGPDCRNILKSLLGDKQAFPKPRYASLRRLYHPESRIQLDQALVLYFPTPHSFTGEDCVELHVHGGRAVIASMLDCLSKLARMAEPGEFTQRAFASNKLDVLQVEALADLLTSDTEHQRAQAMAQLEGHVSAVYIEWREVLIAALAHAEAVIDFGDDEMNSLQDEDTASDVWGGVADKVRSLVTSMKKQLSRRNSELLRTGVKIAIVGPPNAGKSSLFNILAERPAAIVSNTAGTTRDVLEVAMDLGGTKCILQDTAGMRDETDDAIEREGMKRALEAAKSANIVVLMVDSSAPNNTKEMLPMLLETHSQSHIMLAYNKVDLGLIDELESERIDASVSSVHLLSCVTQQGLDDFLAELTERAAIDPDDGLITRARHRQHVEAATEALERFLELSSQGSMAVDMAAEELRLAASELGRITGAVDVEDVLDKLFADFCIGK